MHRTNSSSLVGLFINIAGLSRFGAVAETSHRQGKDLTQLPTILDNDLFIGPPGAAAETFDFLDNVHAFCHRSKDHMFAIKPCSFYGTEKELGAVCVRSSVGH